MDAETTALPTCYRHADRETRLACSACGRPVCVDCVRTAAVGQKCLECAAPSKDQKIVTARDIGAGGLSSTPVTMTLLAASGVVFVLGFLVPPVGAVLGFFGVQDNQLILRGQWYRLFTSAFLHAGTMHLLFNLWALYLFGPPLERRVGGLPFLALYLSSAVAGGTAFLILEPAGRAVGASGAIFGLFGAWLVASYRSRHTVAGQAGFRQLLVLLAINLALPILVPGIAWQAHLGGLVAGGLIAAAWGRPAVASHIARRAAVAAAVGLIALVVAVLA